MSYAGAPKIVVTDFVDEVSVVSVDGAAALHAVDATRLHLSMKGVVFSRVRAGSQVAASVDWLSSTCSDDERTKVCRSLFGVAREAYGATALALSGGGALGTYHFGVVRALHDARLLPDAICGTSAGSIVAVFAAAETTRTRPRLV